MAAPRGVRLPILNALHHHPPLEVNRRYNDIALGPREKGLGAQDPRPVGAPDPFWRLSVGAGVKTFDSKIKQQLPPQYAVGVSNGAARMRKCMTFDAAQLPRHV